MKRSLLAMSLIAAALLSAGCDKPQSTEAKIQAQLETQHALGDDERNLAKANAKEFFERSWPSNAGKTTQGQFINCRPTDSNANGLVTCTGYVGAIDDGRLTEKTMYCGYRKDLVGCSDKDTVLPS